MIIRVGGQRWASLYIRGSPGLVQYEAFHGLRPYPLTLHEPPHFPCQILNQQYWSHTLRQEIFSAPFFSSFCLSSLCLLFATCRFRLQLSVASSALGILPHRAFVLASPSLFTAPVSLAVDLTFKKQKQITLPPRLVRGKGYGSSVVRKAGQSPLHGFYFNCASPKYA